MVSRVFRCDPNRLKLLLDDRLPEDGQAEVARHLEVCESCRRELESLAAGAGWWKEVRQLLRPASPRRLPPATLPGHGPESTGAGGRGEAAADERPRLDFLTPSDDPGKLGRLGPYEIVELVGRGGMGVVLKGFDSSLNRYVAIKVLAPALASSAAARRRFAREAQAAAAVSHEHVVAIHAVDRAGELPYLVMPYVAGESLQKRIERTGSLELREILRIGMQTAAGLAAAHAQGLVHRDVKPANILLENGVERVMITDFGLARAIDDASLTCSGVVAGTPQYMAPEQAKGEMMDHRADLFSLGSVLYAMCTGRSPFRARTTMAVLRRICEDTPRAIRRLNADVPEWLTEIIEKLHEKDPARRFQSAAEVADLLGRHLAHLQQPSTAPMPGRLKRGSAVARIGRSARARWAAAAVLLLLAGGFAATEITGITHVIGRRATRPPRRPPGPAEAAAVTPDTPQAAEQLADWPSPEAALPMGPLALQEAIEAARWGLCSLEENTDHEQRAGEGPDPLVLARGRLDALQRELEGAADPSVPSLPAIATRLGQLEQEDHEGPNTASSPIDESLSEIGARLDGLEFELNADWP